ncbi:ATP-binding protein [Leptothermofonsia sichuanensis E412]|uniref:ATP-binding protein n=1 Tax=Leptothermofonsia sichuanensis TaxID=2917832 RepID=UPI001CA74016|nr:ATP-binding protein [Leptothermofonsia sichuanensis]QZZ23030.1 ATP-binding protein [Leptothermofonsia sichuanensis E412]
MDAHIVNSVQTLLRQVASLLIYQSVLKGTAGQAFLELLQAIRYAERNVAAESLDCLQAYGRWFRALADGQQSWQDYLLQEILWDDNPFTRQVQQDNLDQLPAALVTAVQHDLRILQQLYECSGELLSQWVKAASHLPVAPIAWNYENLPELNEPRSGLENADDWGGGLEALATYYQRYGAGLFGKYRALRWRADGFEGIAYPDPVQIADLEGYEPQKQALLKNTECLLRGYPALNVLLYGSRGSGKSSLVKGLLHKYGSSPLRLIEVAKSDLKDLPAIAECLRNRPQKFILFVDDLSFEEDEDAFKALKVVLEGSVTARPQNLVVYATSNRRHLIREFFDDRPRPRDSEEVHAWDTVQEKLSFSDRFGLTLTFEPADQKTYLKIVRHLATQAGISLEAEDLEYRALQWATRHNGRSGRTARQFVDYLTAELAID